MQSCEKILEKLKKSLGEVVSTPVSKKIHVKVSHNKSLCRQNKELPLNESTTESFPAKIRKRVKSYIKVSENPCEGSKKGGISLLENK